MTSMEEAEKIATKFVSGKKPDAKVSVTGAERKGPDSWAVKGTTWEETERSGSSSDWIVVVTGKEITTWEIKPGTGFFIA